MIKLIQEDLDFIWAQLRLPGNQPVLPLDPTGIRDVQGIGNNIANPTWGVAQTLFARTTPQSFTAGDQTGGFVLALGGPNRGQVSYNPTLNIDYSVRGTMIQDAEPRIISNLVSSQDGLTTMQVIDDPSTTPVGRLSPLTGDVNPLPYSSFMTLFGQFFDHGLDLVHKGQDGAVIVPLLPGDHLYRAGANNNFMVASRTNTVPVDIGAGSSDALLAALRLTESTGPTFTAQTSSANLVAGANYNGNLVLNGKLITIANTDAAGVVEAINAQTAFTGLTASLANGRLTLTPATMESFNTISPFIDLSQSYGSSPSHTVFLREYDRVDADTVLVTGRLVSGGADKNGDGTPDGMATWADIKANALTIGITLHDVDVEGIPMVRMNADGTTWFDANGNARLVGLDKVTGQIVYVQDSSPAALAAASAGGVVLLRTGAAFLDDIAHGVMSGFDANGDIAVPANAARLAAHFIAGDGRTNENIGLTAIHDVFHSEHAKVLGTLQSMMTPGAAGTGTFIDVHNNVWSGEDMFQAAKLITEMQYQHLVFGEFARKLSPNINAFAGYDVTIDPSVTAEFAHAVYRFGHSMLTEQVSLNAFGADGVQLAKPVTTIDASAIATTAASRDVVITIAAHGLSTGNYVTLAGIDAGIGGLSAAQLNGQHKVVLIDANSFKIVAAQAATETATGLASDAVKATLDADSLGLIEAFLNPAAYTSTTAGEVALGMGAQVGNAIDEWMTPALRDNLVGLPLDLAALNIVRARDAGVGTLNEVRQSLFNQTNITSLKPYQSWDEFAANLLHPESLTNFIMAYARDAVLVEFGTHASVTGATPADKLAQWTALQLADPTGYGAALRAAADAAINDTTFMLGGNQDFWDIDLWLGGLAEAKVTGGMLGSTFDFLFAQQMLALQNGDRFYYLERLVGTNLLAEIEAQLFSDIVMRNTGVKHMYSDIFTVADEYVEISQSTATFATFAALQRATIQVVDADGVTRSIGTAGMVGNTFYGNAGNYLDARGVFNPNGVGNESEMLGGTSAANRINALGGNDTVWGDEGADTIEGGLGNDFLHGGDDNDVLTDVGGDDLIWGDAGNDTMNAGSGADLLFGGDGADSLLGGLGADVIQGGNGGDVIYGDNGSLVNGVLDATGDGDVISGDDGNDTIYGGGGADVIDGGTGDDVIYGGIGADVLAGLEGNDRFIMDAADQGFNEAIDGGLGFDVVDYSASIGAGTIVNGVRQGININLSNLGAALAPVGLIPPDSYLSVEGAIGTQFADTLVGGAGPQTDALGFPIFATDANGNPIQAIDPVTLLPEVDLLGNPVFVTLPMHFLLEGRAGADLILGDAGNDTLAGGAGNDTMDGGLGIDTVSYYDATGAVNVNLTNQGLDGNLRPITQNVGGGSGTDTLTGFENLIGGAFNDTLTGDTLANAIEGGAGNDTIVAGAGNDVLVGGLGNDSLRGGTGDDVLTGGAGNDIVNGDGGADTAVFSGALADYTITWNANNQVYTVTDRRNGTPDGVDQVSNIETFRFADQVVDALRLRPPTVTFTTGTLRLAEGGVGPTPFDYVVTLSNAYALPVTVGWTVTGAAVAGAQASDFVGGVFPFGTLQFAPGQTTATISVLVAGDLTAEGDESFLVTLSAPTGGLTLGANATATGTIANDEANVFGTANADTINGTNAADRIAGGAGNDTINGLGGNDTLYGEAGNDSLNGGTGADTMYGGIGDDIYVVDAAADLVVEALAQGLDTVQTTLNAYTLGAEVENLVRTGTANFAGTGNALANSITGGTGADTLRGLVGNDTLIGGAGADTMFGGEGNDVLTGGAGTDRFVFDTTVGVDRVTDFAAGDVLAISRATFTGIGATIGNAQFRSANFAGGDPNGGTAATRMYYDSSSGNLWYDADGSGAGAAVQIGVITTNGTNAANLTAASFLSVA